MVAHSKLLDLAPMRGGNLMKAQSISLVLMISCFASAASASCFDFFEPGEYQRSSVLTGTSVPNAKIGASSVSTIIVTTADDSGDGCKVILASDGTNRINGKACEAAELPYIDTATGLGGHYRGNCTRSIFIGTQNHTDASHTYNFRIEMRRLN